MENNNCIRFDTFTYICDSCGDDTECFFNCDDLGHWEVEGIIYNKLCRDCLKNMDIEIDE